jgi:uncharacterized membrane protein YphA (DoxX/SURF4 family)
MKNTLRQFLFGTSLNDNKVLNIGWLLFRLHIGLSMAIHAGLPKMYTITAPGWFNEQVAGLGFTFPSPAFWATLAAWGEFVGGLCIALGLLTRFNALQLAFQFFVISFLWYDSPEPVTGMYFQNTLFMGYILVAFAGGGRYSLDKLIMNKRKINIAMPIKTAIASLIVLITLSAEAQRGPLKGSGQVVNKTFDYNNFDKLSLKNLDGKIEVTIGKPFAVSVAIDDNLSPLLKTEVSNGELKIELDGNENNKMYIEETNIIIKISMPEASVVEHKGNSSLQITGIVGRYFRIKNSNNGSASIAGSIDELDIICNGNGNVKATEMSAKSIKVKRSGNGNVYIKTEETFTANSSGNGDVINEGSGSADANSSATDNSEIKNASDKSKNDVVKKSQRVHVTIVNQSHQWIDITVKYPGKGSYGIDVKSQDSVKESFPVGTKLFKGNQFTTFKKPIYVVTAATNQTFTIKP